MREIFLLFLRLGFLGFGGPIAVMGMLEEEVCRKRRWITHQNFAEMYAVLKLFPGPLSTQMSVYIGHMKGGTAGGILAGAVFVFPAFVLVLALSYLYVHTGVVARFSGLFSGMQAGALVVILVSTWQLGRTYRDSIRAWLIVALSAVLIVYAPRWEPLLILMFGLMGVLLKGSFRSSSPPANGKSGKSLHAAVFAGALFAQLKGSTLANLFWVCFKAGAFVFGTGLAIVPMLEADVVGKYQWLTHSQFMDGLAIGQITPGPVVITATFIGFQTAGILGALIATVAMFLPSFVNVLFIIPRTWNRLNGTSTAQAFSSWAIPAVIGGILGSTVRLGYLTLTTPALAGIFVAGLIVTVWLKPPAWLLIPICGGVAWVA